MAPARSELLATAFERAPALVARLTTEVTDDTPPEAIITRARDILAAMSEVEIAAVLDAHPRIGADPGSLSPLSRAEQGADADPRVLHHLSALNDAYERKFGFRFVVFVEGRTKAEILSVLRDRFARTREEELVTGTGQFLAIALDRLARER